MTRTIMHVDMDAFFAAVEQRDHPEYRGKPVIVGAEPGGRGVVSTCSYEARRFGIHSAMPISEAYRRCPDGIYVRPAMRLYAEVSEQVMEALGRVSPLVEPVGIDEAYVDISGLDRAIGTPEQIGRQAKRFIHEATRVTATVGIGPNRLIAKIASDYRKPDGLTVVPPEGVLDFLAPLPVGRLRGVGPKLQQQLVSLGLRKVEQLRGWSREALAARFGDGLAEMLYHQARGVASDEVGPMDERKSISKEHTFGADESDIDVVRGVLLALARDVGRTARREGLRGLTVTVKIRVPPFETHTKRRRLDHGTCSDRTIYHTALALLAESGFAGRPVRLIGVGVSDWESGDCCQLDLDFIGESRDERLFAAVDRITERFGRGTVGIGPARYKSRGDKSDA